MSRGSLLWRVERVIILFCYISCNSSIYILVFNISLVLLLLFYLSNFTTVILGSSIIILPFIAFPFLFQNFTILTISILYFYFNFIILTLTILIYLCIVSL